MRSRNIKPGFFKNEQLAECSFQSRLLFPGLWMLADREGRLEYRPKRWKAELFPYDSVDLCGMVRELESHGLIVRYVVDDNEYVWIPHFLDHQNPHRNEKASEIPPYCLYNQQMSDQGQNSFAPRHDVLGEKYDHGLPKVGEQSENGVEARSEESASTAHPLHECSDAVAQTPELKGLAPRSDVLRTKDSTAPADSLLLIPDSLIPEKESILHLEAACSEKKDDFYLTKKKRKLTGKRLESFNRFWKAFGYPRGKAEAADAWIDIPSMTDALVKKICDAATAECEARSELIAQGRTPKMAQGWLSGRRWEDDAACELRNQSPQDQQERLLREMRQYSKQNGGVQ